MSAKANHRLRDARLARPSPSGSGQPMSCRELADAVNAYLASRGSQRYREQIITDRYIRRYENGEVSWPGKDIRDALRAIFTAGSDAELGFHISFKQTPVAQPFPQHVQSAALDLRAGYPETSPLSEFEMLRHSLDTALGSSAMTLWQLDTLEDATSEHITVYPANAPMSMLARLHGDCTEVINWSRQRQPAAIQSRLSRVAALLATMSADAFMRLGYATEAHRWYRSAIHAAADSGDTTMQVLVHAQASMLPYYFGDLRAVVKLADTALRRSNQPSGSAALAAAGKARALARLGDLSSARSALAEAQRLFELVDSDDSDHAFVFTPKRFLFYCSGIYTSLGDWLQAERVQQEALALYSRSPAVPIDPALIELDRSLCLAGNRRTSEAASNALATITRLPEPHRTEIILAKARQVVAATPARELTTESTALHEFLASCQDRTSA